MEQGKRIGRGHFSRLLLLVVLELFLVWLLLAGAALGGATQAWVQRYNGPANGSDRAAALAVDGQGNVYVTGGSDGADYRSELTTIKYGPDGQQLWLKRYTGEIGGHPIKDGVGKALAMDPQGNICVTGESGVYPEGVDYTTIKYSPDGQELWVQRYAGPGFSEDRPQALTVDGQGNIYVTGLSGQGSAYDYVTVKYSAAGEELWVRSYNGPGNGEDTAAALGVDGQGNVYVTGESAGGGTGNDFATVKYSPDGTVDWVKRYSGPGSQWDGATALAVDGQGNVYVTGGLTVGTYGDYCTIKYSPNGNVLWDRLYDGSGYWDMPSALKVDGQGNVYVTGTSMAANFYMNYATVKYSPGGDKLWDRRYHGSGNGNDGATALALDGQGNVYVTGTSKSADSDLDYTTIKYSPGGQELWVMQFTGPGQFADQAAALAVDGRGNVYVTGSSVSIDTGYDFATVKYTQAGYVPLGLLLMD